MDDLEIDDLDREAGELNESHANENANENAQDSQETDNNALHEEQREKLLRLPLGRIKTIIKMDPEVALVNQEAVFLTAKSVVIKIIR